MRNSTTKNSSQSRIKNYPINVFNTVTTLKNNQKAIGLKSNFPNFEIESARNTCDNIRINVCSEKKSLNNYKTISHNDENSKSSKNFYFYQKLIKNQLKKDNHHKNSSLVNKINTHRSRISIVNDSTSMSRPLSIKKKINNKNKENSDLGKENIIDLKLLIKSSKKNHKVLNLESNNYRINAKINLDEKKLLNERDYKNITEEQRNPNIKHMYNTHNGNLKKIENSNKNVITKLNLVKNTQSIGKFPNEKQLKDCIEKVIDSDNIYTKEGVGHTRISSKNSYKNQFSPRLNDQIPLNKISNYSFGKLIGQGAYAIVKEAINKFTGIHVAIKIYEKYRLIDPQRKNSVDREISILKYLAHENIVHMIELIDTPRQLFVVMDLIKGRSLYSYLKSKESRRLPEFEVRKIFRQLVNAICYCHSNNICHRDIKLENIIIDDTKKITLIDFGFSAKVPKNEKLKVFCGTPSYMPPEIVNKKKYSGFCADMWSLGILVYVLLNGSFPFKGANERDLYKKISKGEFKFKNLIISSEAKVLISSLLRLDPLQRPTANDVILIQILKNRFLQELEDPEEKNLQIINTLYKQYDPEIIDKITLIGFKLDEILQQIRIKESKVNSAYLKLKNLKESKNIFKVTYKV